MCRPRLPLRVLRGSWTSRCPRTNSMKIPKSLLPDPTFLLVRGPPVRRGKRVDLEDEEQERPRHGPWFEEAGERGPTEKGHLWCRPIVFTVLLSSPSTEPFTVNSSKVRTTSRRLPSTLPGSHSELPHPSSHTGRGWVGAPPSGTGSTTGLQRGKPLLLCPTVEDVEEKEQKQKK